VRLQGHETARVEPAQVATHTASVVRLWQACFG
jgi:hypothetical protein